MDFILQHLTRGSRKRCSRRDAYSWRAHGVGNFQSFQIRVFRQVARRQNSDDGGVVVGCNDGQASKFCERFMYDWRHQFHVRGDVTNGRTHVIADARAVWITVGDDEAVHVGIAAGGRVRVEMRSDDTRAQARFFPLREQAKRTLLE